MLSTRIVVLFDDERMYRADWAEPDGLLLRFREMEEWYLDPIQRYFNLLYITYLVPSCNLQILLGSQQHRNI